MLLHLLLKLLLLILNVFLHLLELKPLRPKQQDGKQIALSKLEGKAQSLTRVLSSLCISLMPEILGFGLAMA
ncbi:hypothetical protein B0H66DRAFT_563729, partial [Apodospora peruviana]